ncbi:hypothetical protein PAMP_004297 [Pampus punctatissimus]
MVKVGAEEENKAYDSTVGQGAPESSDPTSAAAQTASPDSTTNLPTYRREPDLGPRHRDETPKEGEPSSSSSSVLGSTASSNQSIKTAASLNSKIEVMKQGLGKFISVSVFSTAFYLPPKQPLNKAVWAWMMPD